MAPILGQSAGVEVARRPARRVRPLVPEYSVCFYSTVLGWLGTRWRDGKLFGLTLGHDSADRARDALPAAACEADGGGRQLPVADEFAERLLAYALGRPDDFLDVPLDMDDMTDFQQRVSEACRRIPYGQTTSYVGLAARAAAPRAARAVGNVMARNRLPIVIPCHRVVGHAGGLGGYSAPGGLVTKRRLLALEGALPNPIFGSSAIARQ